MKQLYFSIFATICFFTTNAQCDQAATACLQNLQDPVSALISYTNIAPVFEPGVDYGCITNTTNASWTKLHFNSVGSFTFMLRQYSSEAEGLVDMDLIIYGPFSGPACGLDLSSDKIIFCEGTSMIDVSTVTLTTTATDQYFMLMTTNPGNYGDSYVQLYPYTNQNTTTLVCDQSACPVGMWTSHICPSSSTGNVEAYAANGATLEWFFEGEALPFTTSNISVSEPGTYTVIATSWNCVATQSIEVNVLPDMGISPASDLDACGSTVDLTQIYPEIFGNLNPGNYLVYFTHTYQDALDVNNMIDNVESYTATDSEVIYYTVEDIVSGYTCLEVGSFAIHLTENPVLNSLEIVDQTVTIHASGTQLTYALDGGPFLQSNVFTALSLGAHVITIHNPCGDLVVTIQITTPSAPTGDITQDFAPGATLADISVNGQNILWYASATDLMSSTPLPLSTVLVDGATYFASQTVNGIESPQRLGVTVSLSLTTNDQLFANLSYEPNPVSEKLVFRNASTIDNIEVYALSGQLLKTKNVNATFGEIDFSGFASGVYFVKFTSNQNSRTVRIIK